MKIKAKMAGPGLIINRHAKHSKIEIAIDPSPEGMLSEARRENAPIKILILPGVGEMEPIEISVHPKALILKCERAIIPKDRLADLEALITEEEEVHIVLEYVRSQESLPFDVTLSKPSAKLNVGDLKAGSTREEHTLKFKGLRGCSGKITVLHDSEGWRAGSEIKVGNLETGTLPEDMPARTFRVEALQIVATALRMWCEEVQPGGTADARRSMTRRLAQVCEQIEEQLDPLLKQAEQKFAEDDPKERDGDEDEDI